MMTAVIGRLNISQVIKVTAGFQIFWNLNFFLLIYLCIFKYTFNYDTPFTPFFFDRYGTTYIYIFAAFFGLAYIWFIYNQNTLVGHPRNATSRTSLVTSSIGTAFIFATFVFTSNTFIAYPIEGENLSRFNIIWALTGSVIGTYIGSAIFGRGRVGVKEALVGTITGGVIMGHAAPALDDIGITIMIGVISGFISGLYMKFFDRLLVNRTYIRDSMGLFGPFLMSAIGGSMVVAPSVLTYFYNRNKLSPGLYYLSLPSANLYDFHLAGWQLVYVGVSAGIGLGAGIFSGLLSLLDSNSFGLFNDSRMFEDDFGLFTDESNPNYLTLAPQPNTGPNA
jgi:hypothetical protein